MNRRELLKQIALVTGAVVVGGDFFLMGCKQTGKSEAGFTPSTISLLDEVGIKIMLIFSAKKDGFSSRM